MHCGHGRGLERGLEGGGCAVSCLGGRGKGRKGGGGEERGGYKKGIVSAVG